MIRDAGVFLLNRIVLQAAGWASFEHVIDLSVDDVPELPSAGGVYLLLSERTLFTYPAGASAIYYIGMASNLRTRLLAHRRFTQHVRDGEAPERYFPRYEWGANHGVLAAISARPRVNSARSPRDVERALLFTFAEAYRAQPVANSQSAWSQD